MFDIKINILKLKILNILQRCLIKCSGECCSSVVRLFIVFHEKVFMSGIVTASLLLLV